MVVSLLYELSVLDANNTILYKLFGKKWFSICIKTRSFKIFRKIIAPPRRNQDKLTLQKNEFIGSYTPHVKLHLMYLFI